VVGLGISRDGSEADWFKMPCSLVRQGDMGSQSGNHSYNALLME